MQEPHTNHTTTVITGGAFPKRSKTPQPPLYILPGHVAFRLICHASRIGGLIGKSGSIIKHLQQQTGSKIRVEDPEESDHRVITVLSSALITKKITLGATTREEEENSNGEELFDVSAGQEGIVRVFERVVEVAAEGDVAAIGDMVSCRVLVGKNQVGSIIGKGGQVVEKIRKDTGCRIRVLTPEKLLSCAPTDEIVEIEGDVFAVKKALIAVTTCLREFARLDVPRTQSLPSKPINHTSGDDELSSEFKKISIVDSTAPHREVLFRILCPNDLVGGVIGKGGSIIRALKTETGTSIMIGPTLAGCDERVIIISALESEETEYSAAQKAAVLVFNRCIEAGVENGRDLGSTATARIVVPPSQVGCILGKGGVIVSEIRKMTGTVIRVVRGNQASENDEIVQITGELVNVRDAVHKVTGKLRNHIFSIKLSIGNGTRSSLRSENNFNEPKSSTHSLANLGSSYNKDRPLSPSLVASLTVSGVNHGGLTDIGRKLPSMKGGVELGSGGSRSAIVTNTTVEIVVPDNVIGSIYGQNGSNLARLRQISGAKVMVHEPRPGGTDRLVIISGTPDQTQSAQSLLQAFIHSGSA